ncbi:LIP-domain-containing protein [Microthyrium microscopicum]|uniref:LIP-domain-containing protein n=1 Tax=Microthyrium microscopicum TaxID=703497 RepID=A0A6A6TWY8_9PEZI|nr:LIP-domain-containing protein [Microthyrium microscopicum]
MIDTLLSSTSLVKCSLNQITILIMMFISAISFLALQIWSIVASSAGIEWNGDSKLIPPNPADDPFYKAPPGIASIKPGTILRHRQVPTKITLNNKDGLKLKGAWQILYRTQNSVGEPSATVTTVLVPYQAKDENLFVLNMFSDAAYNGCSPSINLQVGARNDSVFTQAQTMIAYSALTEGWYVSIADDEGFNAAFSSGPQQAYATLDSVRAVLQSEDITGIDPEPRITMYGYSGGGFVGSWVAEIQPDYAPELKIDGIAIGGLVPNMTAGLALYNKNDRSSFIPATLIGLSKDYKNLSMWLDENLIPEKAAELRKVESQCFDSNYNMFHSQDIGKYLKRGWDSIFDPVPRSVFEVTGTSGQRATPKIPLYVSETVQDDVSPIAFTDALLKKWCDEGATILYERNDLFNMSHSQESMYSLGGAFTWMQDRQAGKPASPGCRTTSLTSESLKGFVTLKMLGKILSGQLANYGIPVSGWK